MNIYGTSIQSYSYIRSKSFASSSKTRTITIYQHTRSLLYSQNFTCKKIVKNQTLPNYHTTSFHHEQIAFYSGHLYSFWIFTYRAQQKSKVTTAAITKINQSSSNLTQILNITLSNANGSTWFVPFNTSSIIVVEVLRNEDGNTNHQPHN
jgi:hypothetical protein